MPKRAYEVIQGVGSLYVGAFSLTAALEPALIDINQTPQASAWTDVGFTDDGIVVETNQTFSEMFVDQLADPVGATMVTRAQKLVTNFAQASLENLKYALNTGTITTGASYRYYEPEYDGDELRPTYIALLFDGFAPSSSAGVIKRRRFLVRKALSTENVGTPYKKDSKTLIPVTYSSYYVSETVAPFRIIDET